MDLFRYHDAETDSSISSGIFAIRSATFPTFIRASDRRYNMIFDMILDMIFDMIFDMMFDMTLKLNDIISFNRMFHAFFIIFRE